jgi:guanylate kinase
LSKEGKIITLVSPSGGGKSTIANRLLQDFDKIKFSVSATTRKPREGEIDGVHYQFISEKMFKDYIDQGMFLEWEEFYNGTYYGTLRQNIESELKKGYFVLLDIDVLGALNVQEMYGDRSLTIFLSPPSLEVLRERLSLRGTETDETLNTRIERAQKEIDYADRFDEVVINDQLDDAYQQVKHLVTNFINR